MGSTNIKKWDVAIVGMGIVGISHAMAAREVGASVVMVDKDVRPLGASIRNFGLITLSGQGRGEMWGFARRTREIWQRLHTESVVDVIQRGIDIIGMENESRPLLESFVETEMGEGCELIQGHHYLSACGFPMRAEPALVLRSALEMRIDPRKSVNSLLDWLEESRDVTLCRGEYALDVENGRIKTQSGVVEAESIFICTGDNGRGIRGVDLPELGVTRSKLQMMRIAAPGYQLAQSLMTDLSLIRYGGFADLPEAAGLKDKLKQKYPEHLEHGVHLIVVQEKDGSLVIGDSHHYGDSPDPFHSEAIDQLILGAFQELIRDEKIEICERWIGTYPHTSQSPWMHRILQPGVHLTLVTSGAGMSTAFAIGEKVVREALNH